MPRITIQQNLQELPRRLYPNILDNGDGILCFSKTATGPVFVRILLTDSGHYLVPINRFEDDNVKEQRQLAKVVEVHVK